MEDDTAFIVTQNAGYFHDTKKRSVWLSKKAVSALKQSAHPSLYLYNHIKHRVHGVYTADVSLATKGADKRYAVPIHRIEPFRRSAYHFDNEFVKPFTIHEIDDAYASRLTGKLHTANAPAAPALLTIRTTDSGIRYRYVSLSNDIAVIEDERTVAHERLSEIEHSFEDIMRHPNGETLRQRELASLGTSLANVVFGNGIIRDVLSNPHRTIVFDLDARTASLPFEILTTPTGFFAETNLLSFGVGTNRIAPAREQKFPIRAAVIRIPDDTLLNAEEECEAVVGTLARAKKMKVTVIERTLTPLDLHSIFEANDLVHIISHGEREPNGTRLSLGDGRWIGGVDLASFTSPPAFVFLSACQTAHSPHGDSNYLTAALMNAGVSNIVAARGNTPDRADLDFLNALYGSIISGETNAAAYRNGVYSGKQGVYVRYRFFGAPNVRFYKRG